MRAGAGSEQGFWVWQAHLCHFFLLVFSPFIKEQMPHWQAGNCFNVIMMSSDLRCISHQRGWGKRLGKWYGGKKREDKERRWERKRQVNLLSSLGFARLYQSCELPLVVAAHMHKVEIGITKQFCHLCRLKSATKTPMQTNDGVSKTVALKHDAVPAVISCQMCACEPKLPCQHPTSSSSHLPVTAAVFFFSLHLHPLHPPPCRPSMTFCFSFDTMHLFLYKTKVLADNGTF